MGRRPAVTEGTDVRGLTLLVAEVVREPTAWIAGGVRNALPVLGEVPVIVLYGGVRAPRASRIS